MTNLKKTIIMYSILQITIYLFVSYVDLELNPLKFNQATRFGFCIFSLVAAIFSFIFNYED